MNSNERDERKILSSGSEKSNEETQTMKEVAFLEKNKVLSDQQESAQVSAKTKTEIESNKKKMMTIDQLLKKKFPKP